MSKEGTFPVFKRVKQKPILCIHFDGTLQSIKAIAKAFGFVKLNWQQGFLILTFESSTTSYDIKEDQFIVFENSVNDSGFSVCSEEEFKDKYHIPRDYVDEESL